MPKYQAHAPFINHFASCQMCTESIHMRVQLGAEAAQWCDTLLQNRRGHPTSEYSREHGCVVLLLCIGVGMSIC